MMLHYEIRRLLNNQLVTSFSNDLVKENIAASKTGDQTTINQNDEILKELLCYQPTSQQGPFGYHYASGWYRCNHAYYYV